MGASSIGLPPELHSVKGKILEVISVPPCSAPACVVTLKVVRHAKFNAFFFHSSEGSQAWVSPPFAVFLSCEVVLKHNGEAFICVITSMMN
jgi:hypothetical protein